MPHTVFDERGEMIFQSESDIAAVAFALARRQTGKLTIMFAPHLSAGECAETALEYKARIGAKVKEEMTQEPFGRTLRKLLGRDETPPKQNPYL